MTFMITLFLLLSIALLGCSGGGDSSAPPPSPSMQVLPASYDFGSVTPGNSPAPLEVEIANNGTAGLNVDNITLSDTTNFSLDLSTCGTTSRTISAGDNCSVEIAFTPTSDAPFNANLTITSNDPDNPTLTVPLIGTREPISELHVKINQVETSCSSPVVTAYVSVIDQGGYPVTSLLTNDFTVTETGGSGYTGPPTTSPFVENVATLSVAVAMDYSGSIIDVSDALSDMEDSVANFVGQLGLNDEAEIIKFATDVKVAQDFTPDKTLLTNAIYNPLDVGVYTALYDAVVQAVDDTAKESNARKAVIVITDGVDDDGTHTQQLSKNSIDDVIFDANSEGIPVFTVGIGNEIDIAVLQQIADDTGGQFYEALTTDNLRTIYQQLADVLFKKQYILTYTSGLGDGPNTNLTIGAELGGTTISGNDTKTVSTSCP